MLESVFVSLIKLDYFLKNSSLRVMEKVLFRKNINHTNIKNILIFRTGSLGDSICAMPAIESIKNNYPKATIDLLTESGGESLVSINNLLYRGYVNEYIFYKKQPLKKLIGNLRKTKYDLFILLPQSHATYFTILRNLIFAKLISSRYATGFSVCVTRLLPRQQAKQLTIPNIRDFLLSIVQNIGIDTKPFINSFSFNVTPKDISFTNDIFDKNNLNRNKTVGLSVGAKRPQNRWPIEYFDKVINYLIQNNYQCIIIGGKEDTVLAKKLETYKKVIDLTGQLTPIQSGLCISVCTIFITNDTGPMHLSYAFGTKTIALFSSRDYPNLWYPPKENSFVFRNNSISCSECFTETCNDNQCMKQILPDQVIEKISSILPLKSQNTLP